MVASNLYDLLVHDLAILVSGADEAEFAVRQCLVRLPREQQELRRHVHGLGQASRSCLPDVPGVFIEEGVVLPRVRDSVVEDLLAPLLAGPASREAEAVFGARIVDRLHKVAVVMEVRLLDAAQDAHLLGSAPLRDACRIWAGSWIGCRNELAAHRLGFRANAYPSDGVRQLA